MALIDDKVKVSWPVLISLLGIAATAAVTGMTARAADKTANETAQVVQQKADASTLKEVIVDVNLLKVVTAKQSVDLDYLKAAAVEQNRKLDRIIEHQKK